MAAASSCTLVWPHCHCLPVARLFAAVRTPAPAPGLRPQSIGAGRAVPGGRLPWWPLGRSPGMAAGTWDRPAPVGCAASTLAGTGGRRGGPWGVRGSVCSARVLPRVGGCQCSTALGAARVLGCGGACGGSVTNGTCAGDLQTGGGSLCLERTRGLVCVGLGCLVWGVSGGCRLQRQQGTEACT